MASGTLYRNTFFAIRGFSQYTRNGYVKAARNFNPADLEEDVSSRSFMVTGANSGLGKVTALALAKKGATVHMVCRNQERGEQAKQEIVSESGNDKVQLHILDISAPQKTVEFADSFVQSGQPLDVLVNNAGAMVNARTLTEDGLEKNFATNTLGTYILTMGLIPMLQRSPSPRVITVSSGGMYTVKLDPRDLQFEDFHNFDGTFAYAQNKRQQVVMNRKWAERFPNIHFSAMHPGWADTPGVATAMPQFRERLQSRLRSIEEGADTIVWLSVAKRVTELPSGQFFQDRQPVSEHLPLAWTRSSNEDEELLMTRLEELHTQFSTPQTQEGDQQVSSEVTADQQASTGVRADQQVSSEVTADQEVSSDQQETPSTETSAPEEQKGEAGEKE